MAAAAAAASANMSNRDAGPPRPVRMKVRSGWRCEHHRRRTDAVASTCWCLWMCAGMPQHGPFPALPPRLAAVCVCGRSLPVAVPRRCGDTVVFSGVLVTFSVWRPRAPFHSLCSPFLPHPFGPVSRRVVTCVCVMWLLVSRRRTWLWCACRSRTFSHVTLRNWCVNG